MREIELLGEATVSFMTERRTIPPYPLAGGKPGSLGRNALIRNGKRTVVPGKARREALPGDIISIQTPGGGGWGKGREMKRKR